jgi:hypothetical protein
MNSAMENQLEFESCSHGHPFEHRVWTHSGVFDRSQIGRICSVVSTNGTRPGYRIRCTNHHARMGVVLFRRQHSYDWLYHL